MLSGPRYDSPSQMMNHIFQYKSDDESVVFETRVKSTKCPTGNRKKKTTESMKTYCNVVVIVIL